LVFDKKAKTAGSDFYTAGPGKPGILFYSEVALSVHCTLLGKAVRGKPSAIN
jgi:hypothetical protein